MPDNNKPIKLAKSIFDGAKSIELINTSGLPSTESIPVGLTPEGKKTTYGESQYDIPETTAEAIQSGEYKYYRGERQSAADKWANGIIRFVGKTPARMLEGVLNPFLGTSSAIVNQDVSKIWDNELTNAASSISNALDENFPLYQTRESESATGFSKLGYLNTYVGDILDGVSYSVAAMGSGNFHTKLLGALAKSSVVGKTSEFVGKLMSIENASDKYKYITQIDDVFKTQIKDGVKKGTYALMGATTEASDNALSDSNGWAQEMEIKLTTDEYGRKVRELTPEEKQWIEENRKKLGNVSFGLNLPVIITDNFFTFGKAVMGKGAEKALMSEVSDLIEQTAEGGYKAAKKGFIQSALDKTYGIRKVAGKAIPEALQEQMQYAISKGTEDFYTKKYYNPSSASFIESMQVGLADAFATQEGWDQALIGGIVGGLTGNVVSMKTEGLKSYKSPTDQLVSDALELLNNTKAKDAYKSAMETINRHANLTEEQAAAAKANDNFEYQNKQSDLFLNYVLGRIKTGKTQDLINDLDNFKTLSPEEFENTYDVKLGVDELTGTKQTVADFVQKRLDKVNKIEKLYNSLENIVPNAPSNLKDRLLYSAFALEDSKDRAAALDTEVKDIVRQNMHTIFNPTEKAALMTDYTQLTEPAARQLFKETIANSTLSPIDQQTIIDKLNDFDKLRDREAQFVKEYKELRDPQNWGKILEQDAQAEDVINNADEKLQTGTAEEPTAAPTDLTNLEKEFETKSTEDLNSMLAILTDPNSGLATDPEAIADIRNNIDAINKVLDRRSKKTTKPTEQQPVDKKVTPSGTTPQYTEEELAELMDEDLFVPEVPEVGELEEDEKTFTKVVELQKKLEAGEISQEDFNEGIANIGKAVKPREPVSVEQDIVSNSMVNEYVDTAELSDDNDINKQDVVQTSNADGKTLAKMSNIGMMSLFKHKIELIGDGIIRLFRWVRGADGKVVATNTAISNTVNNPTVASKGSKIIYRVVELNKEVQETNNSNIERSRKIIKSALKAYPQLGYTETDAKFEGDVYTATIGMFTKDGTLVGYYQLPHALDITKTTSSEDMANYVKVRQQILAERKAILDKIANNEEASTEVLDKGYGNLLTQVVDNKPVMQGNLFEGIREEDKFNGQPVFIFEGAKGFEIKGYQELRDEYNSFVTSLPKFNKTGRVYQVVRAANGEYSIIPVYTNLITSKVADKIVQVINNLDEAPNYNDIISALNPYVYAGDSKKKPGVSIDVSGDGAKTKFNIGGETYTLQELQSGSSRINDFKQALTKKRHNLEVNKLNDANYQKELTNNNAISTNAYTEGGQYFVQPLIVVKPIVGETVKVEPIKEKVTEVTPTQAPASNKKADIERSLGIKLSDYLAYTMGSTGAMTWDKLLSGIDNDGNPIPENEKHVILSSYDLGDNYFAIGYKANNSPNTINFQIYKKGNNIAEGKAFVSSSKEFNKLSAKDNTIENKIKELNTKYDAELDALEGKEAISTTEPITNDDIIITTKDEVETDEEYKKAQEELSKKSKYEVKPDDLFLNDGDAFSRGSAPINNKPVDTSVVAEAIKFIEEYVPFLTLSDLRTVAEVKGSMIDAVGMLRGTTMYLFQGSTVKTAYHEAFHGVFRNMLTKAEQQAVIDEMRAKYGKPTKAELDYQIEAIPAYYKSVLSEEQINKFAENKHYEEKLADEFQEVADNEINKPWYKKIADFFKRIFNMFNIFSKTTMSESELLFRNILTKKYAKGNPVVLNKNLSAYNELPAFSRSEQDAKISPVTRGQRVNSIAAEFTKRYMTLVKSGKTITKEDGPRIFKEIYNSYRDFVKTQAKEGFPNLAAAQVANYVQSNFDQFTGDAISVIRTTYKIKADKTGIIEMLNNQLDSEEQGEDVEYTEIEETGMTKEYGQDFINISGIKSASTRLKLALSFVPKRDANGSVEKDPYGFDKYYSHEQVYYWLERNLVGITDMGEMLDAIKSASVFKPELADVYNMLTELKEGDDIKEHEMFRNEFRSNFAKQQMAYLLVLFEKQAKGEAPKYKIIDSNRQSLGREIFDRWKNNVKDISGTIAETTSDGQTVVYGTKAAKELKTKYQSMIGTITPSQIREVLAKIGIIYSDGVVEKVFESNEKEAMIKAVIPVLDWYASDDPAIEETQGRINLGNLVKYELNGNLNSYTSSFNNVENRAVYTIQNPSYASKILSTIKGKKSKFDAFYNERMKDPFFRHSNLLEELSSNVFREERFKVFFLNGLKDGKGTGIGAKWTKMSAADKFSMVLELFSNKKETIGQVKTEATAYYSNITESDKTLHSIIRSKKYAVKTIPTEVNGKTTRVINPNSEIVDKFYNIALNEAGRIKSALEFKDKLLSATGEEKTALESKLLQHYHFSKNKTAFDGQAYKFMQIDGLNTLLEPITEAINNNRDKDISDILEPLKTEIKQTIANDLTRLYRLTVVEAVNSGAVKVEKGMLKSVTLDVYDLNEEGNRKGLRPEDEQLKIQQLLASFSANEYLNNIEYSAIMNGDLAFYKPGDGPKRFYQANSMTRSWNTNTISKIKFSVVDDLEVPTNEETLKFLTEKLGNKVVKNWGEGSKLINVTDATVFVSPEMFLKIHEAQGTWTPAIQKAYDIAQGTIEADTKDTSWHNQISVSKPFIYGQEYDASIGAMRPVQIKCTFVPLLKTFTDNNPLLADLATRMKESGTDAVAMKSAMKASMNITDDLLTSKLGFNNTLEVSVDNAGTQVDNPDHLFDSVSSSNRQQKMLLPAMIDLAHTYNGRSGADIRSEINQIEAVNVSEDMARIDKIFGTREFNEDIAEALNSRNANNNQRQILHVNDDNTFDYPLDMINSTNSENLISSIFTKRVVKQDFKGGSAVQVTGVGYKFKSDYKTVADVQKIIDSNEELKKLQSDLQYIKASKSNPNQIDYVDVVMPAWDSRFFKTDENGNTVLTDINSLPDNIKNFILQRIPNEGPHSNMVVRVKQFLPAEYGNMIILPYEVTKQLGSDFDFDKVFFHITEFFKDKDGKFKKVEFIEGDGKAATEKRYKYYVNSVINKEESKNIFKEFIDVYERYSGESIESLSKNEKVQALIETNKLLTLEDFSKLSIIKQNTKQARNNRLLDNYDTVLRDIRHLEDVTTPSGFDNIQEVFDKVSGKSTLLNFYTGNTQRYLADLFHAIIGLKGQSATHVTGHAFASMMNLSPKTKFYLVDKNFKSTEYNSLSNRTSKDDTLIIKDISSMMAAILDAVKNPDLLPGLGINSVSIDAWSTLVRLGMGVETASLFTSSPAIKELTNMLIANKNQIKPEGFQYKFAKDIVAKYMTELNAVKQQLPEDQLNKYENSYIAKAIANNKTYVSLKPDRMLFDIQTANEPNKLNDPLVKAEYLANQIRLVQMYVHMEGTMKFLNDFNRFTGINKEVGPNMEDIVDKVYLEKKLMNSNAVEGFMTESLPQLNSIFNAHRLGLEKLNEHFPYATDQYNDIKMKISRSQYKDTGGTEDMLNIVSEDRQKINGFIKAYTDANSPTFKDITESQEKKRLFTKVPLILAEIQKPSNDKKEGYFNGALRKSALIENLKVERLTEGENLFYISLKGNRITTDTQNLMIDSFMALYNNPQTKEFAIDLIKHSFASTGFYTGLNSFSHIIPPSILMDLGYVEYRRNEVAFAKSGEYILNDAGTNNLIDQLVRNFPKIFTDTYDDTMFIGFETESKPEQIMVDEAKLEESNRSNTFIVGESMDEDGVPINKYQRYIRVYSNKYKGSLLYKNVSVDGIDTRYNLVNYLGQSGKLIELNPTGYITESIIRTNNYKTPKATVQPGPSSAYEITQNDVNDSEDSNDEMDMPVEKKQDLAISTPSTESIMTADQLGLGDLTADDLAELEENELSDFNDELRQVQEDADDLPDDIEPGDCKPSK